MECLYRVCSSVSIPSSSCAICPGSARRLASSWSFTAFARAFASWTCFLVRLACWLSNTILPGCTSALLLRVVTVMVGQGNASAMCPSRRLSESSSVTPPSRILRVNLNSSSATRHGVLSHQNPAKFAIHETRCLEDSTRINRVTFNPQVHAVDARNPAFHNLSLKPWSALFSCYSTTGSFRAF